MTRIHTILYKALAALILMSMTAGCSSSWEDEMVITHSSSGSHLKDTDRTPTEETRKLLLLYSAGYNNIQSYLQEDIEELKQGWFPTGLRHDDIILVYSHASKTDSDYKTPTTPYLIRLYRGNNGEIVADTVITYPENTISASAIQLNKVLSDVKRKFRARSYGMIFSSHASGFLPAGFYSNPSAYKFKDLSLMSRNRFRKASPVPYEMPEADPSRPMVKSIGMDLEGTRSSYLAYEIDLREFAEAIPMKMDYILFDCCLMGGVEVAYELREKCRKVGFSQAEVLADGLNYRTLAKHLVQNEVADPQAVCEDFFRQYEDRTGAYKSATISLASTEDIEELAAVCATLFERYHSQIKDLSKYSVQGFGGSKSFFFDLADVLRCAGASKEEMDELQAALNKVIIYKNNTGQYYCGIDGHIYSIGKDKFSGLTMHLPGKNESELDKYYRTLGWNMATELVEYQE